MKTFAIRNPRLRFMRWKRLWVWNCLAALRDPSTAFRPRATMSASSAAASAFGRLSAAIQMPADGTTLEQVVRELLTPLLAAWLDEHLPAIVQAKVDEEVERIARGRVR